MVNKNKDTAHEEKKRKGVRKDGLLQKSICIGVDSETGKRKFKVVYGKSKAELTRKAAVIIDSVEMGIYADDKHKTLESYAKHWLLAYKADVSASTRHGYNNIIKNHLGPCKFIRLKDLKKSDLQIQLNSLSSPELKRRFKLTLNQILETAIEDGLIYRNVCRNIVVPPLERAKKRALTELEEKAIEKADLSQKERAFIELLKYTGIRKGEALALTKSDIDLKNNRIHINKALSFNGNSPSIGNVKTYAGNRDIDILSPLRPSLEEYLSTLKTLIIFPNRSGQSMSKTSSRKFWEVIYRKLNTAAGGTHKYEDGKLVYMIEPIKGLTPHIFRHNYATILYYAKVDLKDAARILGHADIRMIIDVYAHLDKQKSDSTNKIEEYLAKIG